MSTHPNAILLARLTPDGLSRKTMREILTEAGVEDADPETGIKIGDANFSCVIMESDYEDSYQLSGQEGDLLFFKMVTYGYGTSISWEKLSALKAALEEWALGVCKRHHCAYAIEVTANYW